MEKIVTALTGLIPREDDIGKRAALVVAQQPPPPLPELPKIVLPSIELPDMLPDMLPDNLRLRREQQPLSAFVERTCRLAPALRAGTAVNYQSMGFAILAELVHQASGRLLPEFLAREVFGPLGMADTSLGWDPPRRPIQLPRARLLWIIMRHALA